MEQVAGTAAGHWAAVAASVAAVPGTAGDSRREASAAARAHSYKSTYILISPI